MYDPIVKIYEANSLFNEHIENEVFSIIKRYNIDVDKDELIRALNYDRNQYDKGYADGVRDFYRKLIDKVSSAEIVNLSELDEILSELGVDVGGALR